MPSQNIEVGLRFTADTSNASRQISRLKDEISQAIQNVNNPKTGDLGFEKAINQAAQLRGILDAATDDAGKLDLSKFQRGLAAAGLDMNKVYSSLHAIGAENAFGRLANQINQANVHSQILSGTLKKFATGLKNTAMWTIQSNAIHAVQGALQGAFSYAQRLNKGLTDIAIVSDLSTDQLAAFAKSANAAAKELSTTTNEYVKGALIYYQQGLNDKEVQERTNTTIKMANASGESAETISSYMTAIWNNFDHGSESVEHYADVIALLGATTAASNAQIAEGMQAFAATAETVGLSYEYSAAALTTLVDRTQQSASKIGTSLKTIFARLSSVSLGETLEDDVNLTKYTKALEKVGVDVLDATGDLKDMNDILDELGAKWDTLNQAQKVAVAQTVGGVRQYNNLISLLDNYDYFKSLVSEAEQADGYLQTQQDKYAASWEGANKRLQASWETLYSQILDDKFFIGLTNTLADVVNFITDAIDGMGGMKGIISSIIALVSSIHPERFEAQIIKATESVKALAAELSGAQLKANIQIKTENLQTALGGAVANGEYSDKINSMYEQIQTWITQINELQAKGDTAHASALLEITSRYSALADKAVEYNNQRQRAINDLYDTDLPDSLLDAISKQGGSTDKQLNGYQNLYNDLQNGDLNRQREILLGLKSDSGRSYGLNGLSGNKAIQNLPNQPGQIGANEVNSIFQDLQRLMHNRMSELARNMGKDWETLFKGDLFKLDADKILEKFEAGDGKFQDAVAGAILNKAENISKQIQEAEAEKKLLEDAGETVDSNERLQALQDQLAKLQDQKLEHQAIVDKIREKEIAETGVKSKIEAANVALQAQAQTQEKINAKQFDMKKFAGDVRSVTQLISSMSMLNSAFDGLVTNIKEGNLTFGSLTGSITGLAGSLPMMAMGLSSVTKMLEGTALAGTKFFTALSGPWGLAIMALIAILPTLIKLLGDLFPPSLEERLETVNEQLTAQKQVVKDLASEYADLDSQINSLTSAYEDLIEAEQKFGNNSPQYWLARAEYLDRIAELIDKYGEDIVNYDENGIPQINGEVYGQKVLSEFNTNKQYELDLEASKSQIQAEYDRSYDRVTDKAGWWTVPAGGENLWKTIIGKIEEGAYTEDWAERFVRTNAEHASDETVQAFVDAATEYMKSYADADKAQSLAQQNIQDTARATGVYDAANMMGVEADTVNNAIDQVIQARLAEVKADESLKQSMLEAAQQAYLNTHEDAELKNGIITDSEGNIVDNDTLLQSQILAEMATNIQTGDQEIVNAILSNSGINGNDLLKANSMTEDQRIEADRLAGATQDTETLGLDAEVVNQTTQAIDALVDAEENLEDSQKRFSEKTKDNEGSLKKLANAAEKTQEGFDELEEGYTDWYDAIRHGDELAKAKAMAKLKDSIGDIIGVTDELAESGLHLGEHFGKYLEENQDVVEGALAGDSEAIEKLQRVAAEDIAIQIGVDEAADQELLSHVGSTMDMVQAMLDSGDLKLGAVDNSALLASLTETINAVAMDVNQAEALLASMGFDAEVEQATETSHSNAAFWVPPIYEDAKGDDFTYQKVVKEGYWEERPSESTTGVTALRIKTADYVGGGNILGAKGGTAAGANRVNNAKGKGKGGGGGGGGGGSGKSNKAKKADRYHEITDKLDQQSKKLKEISTYEERAYGKERQQYVQDHINALKTEADLYGQLAKEAKNYLDSDKKALEAYGTQFNADGTIKNFDSWYNKWAAKLKDDEEGLAAFEEAIKNYEESLDKYIDAKQSQLEKLNEAYDLQLKNINDTLKEQNDLIQDNLDLLEYMFNRLNDDGSDAADAIANLNDQMTQLGFKAEHYEQAITDLLKNAGASSKDIQKFLSGKISIDDLAKKLELTPEAIDNLREYASALLDINENMYEMRENAIDQLTKALDKFAEEADKAARKTEFYAGHLEHLKNVIDVVGKDALGVSNDILEGLSDAAFQTALREIEIARTTLDEIEYDRQRFAEQFANGLMTEDEYNAMMDDLNDRWMDAMETLAEKEEDALEAAENVFQTHLTNIVEDFEKAMSGPYKTLDHLQDVFDKQKKLNDLYVDDYQKIHDLSKLGRDIQKSMDNTDNVKAMEYLKELQDEVNDGLRDGNKLNEYDIQVLEKKYQLRLAQIALEEAQNAKNQVRMTRTSEGDWSYTYYADEDATANAQQNYEDKLYEFEQLTQERIANVSDYIMEAMREYADSIADLNISDGERVQLLQQYEEQLMQTYGQFLDDALGDAKWIEGEFNVIDHHLINDWDETTLAAVTNFETLEDMQDAFITASGTMVDSLEVTYERWVNDWQTVLTTAGDDATNYGNQVKTESENVIQYGQDVVDAYEQQVKDQETKVWEPALANLTTFLTQWKKKIDEQIRKNVELVASIDSLIAKYGELATKAEQAAAKATQAAAKAQAAAQAAANAAGSAANSAASAAGSRDRAQGLQTPTSTQTSGSGGSSGLGRSYMMTMDSGGYTGEWGNEGRIAMLHEKELVLNKTDTTNILNTVEAVRDIAAQLSANANISAAGLGELASAGIKAGTQFEQIVNITAEFPDAVYHDEIEQAFDNLLGRTAQFLLRK